MWQVHGTRSLSDVRMRMRRSRRRESCDLYVRRDSMSMTRDTTMDNQSRFFSEISASLESLCTSLAALGTAPKGQGMWRDRYNNISFLRLIFTSSRLRRASLCYRRDRESSFSRSERANCYSRDVPVRVYRMLSRLLYAERRNA